LRPSRYIQSMARVGLLAGLAGCWTGSPPPPPSPPPSPPVVEHRPLPRLEIHYQRTMCLGRCPVFELTIHPSGRFEWTGERFVAVVGTRTGQLAPRDLEAIDRALGRARFFERDETGHFPVKPACVRSGNTTSCSFTSVTFCTDTSHSVIEVKRGARRNRVDDAHCSNDDDASLAALEALIVDRTRIVDWIGERP